MSQNTFTVNEHFNGFSLTHNASGANHWLSDGVDCVFDESDKALSPGSEGFCDKWAAMFNSDVGQTMEAYFPDHVEAKYISRWDNGTEVSTACMYDAANKVCYSIEQSDTDVEDATLDGEFVELADGTRLGEDEDVTFKY
jgi:hypothetical protein